MESTGKVTQREIAANVQQAVAQQVYNLDLKVRDQRPNHGVRSVLVSLDFQSERSTARRSLHHHRVALARSIASRMLHPLFTTPRSHLDSMPRF